MPLCVWSVYMFNMCSVCTFTFYITRDSINFGSDKIVMEQPEFGILYFIGVTSTFKKSTFKLKYEIISDVPDGKQLFEGDVVHSRVEREKYVYFLLFLDESDNKKDINIHAQR